MSLQSLPSTPAVASSTPAPTSAALARIIENFGSFSVPQIEFGASFDNRKEISLVPVDKSKCCICFRNASSRRLLSTFQSGITMGLQCTEHRYHSALMCDTLVNSCGADQTARTSCASARATADKHTAKTGTQADGPHFQACRSMPSTVSLVRPLRSYLNVL